METQGYYENITHRVGSINEVGVWSCESRNDVKDLENNVDTETVMDYIGCNNFLNGERIKSINSKNLCEPITSDTVSEWLERCRQASDIRSAPPTLTVAKYQFYKAEHRTQELVYYRDRDMTHRLEALEKGIDPYLETLIEGCEFETIKGLVHSLVKVVLEDDLDDFEDTILGSDADGFDIDAAPEQIKVIACFVNDPRIGSNSGREETDWAGHGDSGHVDYIEDSEGNKYCSLRELRAAGVSELHVENVHQIDVT